MTGFGFGSRVTRRLPGASIPLTLTPGSLAYASVRFPPENGEDPVSLATSTDGEGGLLYLASSSGSANLVSSSSKWLGTAGALVVCCTLDELIYDAIARVPHLVGTSSRGALEARSFGLLYVPRCTTTYPGEEHCFAFHARGESAASAHFYGKSAPIPDGTRRILVAVRFDGTDFTVDLWDCETGTKTAGTPTAKPTGWLGIQNLAYNTTIGAIRESRWPLLAQSNLVYLINAFRGEIDFVSMLDTNPSDADFQAVALGADPVTVFGSASCRLHAGLADNNGVTFPVTSNRAAFSSGATLTKRGTLYPGSTVRRQSSGGAGASSLYLTLDRLHDPCLCSLKKGDTSASLPVSFKIGGTSGAITVRKQDEDGNIVGADWQAVATASGATASGTVTLPWHPSDKAYRLTFRISDGAGGYLYARANTDVVVCHAMVDLGQSEMVRGTDYGITTTGATGNPLGLSYSAGTTGGKYVYRVGWKADNGGTKRPVIIRSRFNWHLATGPQLAKANRLRAHTSRPLVFVNATDSGTSAFDFMDDGTTSRQWSDFTLALSALGNRDSSGRPMVREVTMMWEAFFAGSDWSAQVLRPLATGVQSVTQSGSYIAQADIDHWLFDTVTLNPAFDLVVLPANRHGNATGASATTDAHAMADRRLDMRTNPTTWYAAALVGPECGVHACEAGTDTTHPDTTRLTGQLPWSRKVADGHAVGLGLLAFTRPAVASAAFSGGNTVITVSVSGKSGDSLDTEGNAYAAEYGTSPVSPIGLSVSGFEVQDGGAGAWTKDGFTPVIATGSTITLTKSSGSWAAGTKIRFNPGGPGSYSGYTGATEDTWVKANPVFGGHEVAGGNSAVVVA